MSRSRLSLLTVAGALLIAACDRSPVAPGPSASRTSSILTPSGTAAAFSSVPAAPASFYQACLTNGALDAISSIGSSTSANVVCKGRGTAVVLRAGSAVGFCYQPGKSPSGFIVGTASCAGTTTAGGFAAGSDYYGCVDKGSLTGLAAQQTICKKGTSVGLSKPKTYTLTVVKAGTGSGSVTSDVGGINCPTACTATFVENTQVTLTSSVGSASDFSGWSDASCTGATCTVLLTSNATVTATFALQTCTPSLSIDGTPVGTDGITLVYRKDSSDFRANLQLSSSVCGSWSTAWTYRFGDDAAVPVPASWIIDDTLRVPRWTLEKYAATGKRYTFMLTATPPVGSPLPPLTATRLVQVIGTRPVPAFSPTGFRGSITSGTYVYKAFGLNPYTIDPDNPPDNPRLRFIWYAEVFGGDEIVPVSGQGTPTVSYTWTPAETFLIRMTACPSDELDTAIWGFTGCTTTSDFVFSTNGG